MKKAFPPKVTTQVGSSMVLVVTVGKGVGTRIVGPSVTVGPGGVDTGMVKFPSAGVNSGQGVDTGILGPSVTVILPMVGPEASSESQASPSGTIKSTTSSTSNNFLMATSSLDTIRGLKNYPKGLLTKYF
jgi:hypothetical protein